MSSAGSSAGHATAAAVSSARYLDPASAVLPGIQMPVTLPAFMREGHAIDVRPVFSDQPMQTGTARRRHVYQSTPRKVSVSLELDLTQIVTFHAWYEGALRAGTEFFSCPVAAEGVPGVRWWKSRFSAPYIATYLGGQWWKVSADLALFGDGATTAPMPTALTGRATVALLGSATLLVPQPLHGGVTVALLGGTTVFSLTGHVTAALLPAFFNPPASVGAAAGTSTALGVAGGFRGAAAGVAVATGVGTTTAVAAGSSSGSAAVTGVSPSTSSARLREGGGYRLRTDGSRRLRES